MLSFTLGFFRDLWSTQFACLFIPASVHLYMDKTAGELLLTNPRVVWEYPYSDQWEPKRDNQTDPQSQASKLVTEDGQSPENLTYTALHSRRSQIRLAELNN